MPSALAELVEAYTTRAVTGRTDRGGEEASSTGLVVGYVGGDVPVELFSAARVAAVRLFGDPAADTTTGDRYLGRGLDPAARSVLTRLLAGDYGELDRLVVSRDCEASLRLFYAVRELRRVEPQWRLPQPYLVDVLHLPHHTTTRYNRVRLGQLRDRIAEWTGQSISDGDLSTAVACHDEQRRLLAEVARLRRDVPARLSGTEFLAVVGAGTAMPVTTHSALLRRLLAQAADLPARPGRRVFFTGSAQDTPDVYRALEGAGFTIVGEDHSWGDLLFERPVGTPREDSTLDALAERYQYNGPTAQRAPVRERAQHAATAARRCRAEMLVCYARQHDEAPPWDFAAQRDAVDLPSIVLENQAYGRVDLDEVRAQAEGAR